MNNPGYRPSFTLLTRTLLLLIAREWLAKGWLPAAVLALAPTVTHASPDTLNGTTWNTNAFWSLNAMPGVNDNAIIAVAGTVNVNPAFVTQKEIQDITFNSTGLVKLHNNSSTQDMTFTLNGGRGTGVPIISSVGDFLYTFEGQNISATPRKLNLQLKMGRASGDISVAANTGTNALTINSIISETGGAQGINKTGAGRLILGGANTFTGGTTITAGVLVAAADGALGTGPVIVQGGTLQVGNGGTAGTLGSGPVTNNGTLAFKRSDASLVVTNDIGGTGAVQITGSGTVTLGGAGSNSYLGVTTVSSGTLIAGKAAGVQTIPGDLIISTGAIFRLGASDQIADTAVITINGGSFGDPATSTAPPNPGPYETVASVIVNGGNFLSNRNFTGMTVSTLLKVTAGTALAQRGGIINAGAVEITGGAVSLDGGSTVLGNESRLNIGSGGLKMTGGVINFNNGPSAMTAASTGSILNLGGNVISVGTTSFVRVSAVVGPKAVVDLGGVDRTFDVTGTMTIGVNVANGGILKAGPGTLTLEAANDTGYDVVIRAGTLKLNLGGSIAHSTIIVGDAGSSGTHLDVTAKTGGFTIGSDQTIKGIGQIDGNATILGIHAPGNSAGLQTFNGNLSYASTSTLNWELTANASTDTIGIRGLDFDGVDVINTGGLTVGTGVTSNLIFNATSSTVNWNDAFWDTSHSWLVYDNANLPSLASASIFDTISVSTDSIGGTLSDGTFSWKEVGNDVVLNFSAAPVPEPGSFGLLLAGAFGFVSRRRGKD